MRGKHRKPEKIYSIDEAYERLYDLFRHHGFEGYPEEKLRQLAHFYKLLMEQQEKENFTRLLKFREIGIKHFVDCLMVPRLIKLKYPIADMGTGPGFPGIPLKIDIPDSHILLVEGVRKRVQFLKEAREQLGLERLDIIGRYVDKDFTYPCNMVITRAVADISESLGHAINCLKPGGKFVFMKGPNANDELEKAKMDWKGKFNLTDNIKYELPNTPHQRRLIAFEKLESSPA